MTGSAVNYFVSGLAVGVSLTTLAFQFLVFGVPPQLLHVAFYRDLFLLLAQPILYAGYALVFWRMGGRQLSRPTAFAIVTMWTLFMLAAMGRVGYFGGVS